MGDSQALVFAKITRSNDKAVHAACINRKILPVKVVFSNNDMLIDAGLFITCISNMDNALTQAC